MILKALIDAKKPLSAEELSKITKSSLRTIKSDIFALNGMCEEEGAVSIRSFKAKGYQMEVKDEEAFNEFSNNISILHSLYYGRSVEAVNRRIYILQRLLVNEQVLLEDLCEELFLSRSSIRKDIAWVNGFLGSYHLKLDSAVGRGYFVSGKEQDLRSAMVELRCSQYHEFQPLYPYPPFDAMFCKDGVNHYKELRKAFLDILRASRIVISDIATKKIASHLCLTYQRGEKGAYPQLDEDIIEELKQTYDYKIAKKIYEDPIISAYAGDKEIEVINLARLLLINRELNYRTQGTKDLPVKLVEENKKIYEEIIASMEGSIGSYLHRTDFFKVYSRDFESLQMELYLRHHFDHLGKMRFVTYAEGNQDLFSPIPLELTRAMVARLQLRLGTVIRDAAVMGYAGVHERLLKKVVYPYKKLRLAVITTEGLVYTQHVAEGLSERFSGFIEYIDVFNLYEMRKVDFNDYDAIISSNEIFYYYYPLPIVKYTELDYNKEPGELFDSLFRYGFDRNELQRIKQQLNIYEQIKVDDIERFVEALSYRYGRTPEDQKMLLKQFVENEQIINHYYARNGISIIFMPYRYTGKEIFDIYVPEQTIYFEEVLEVQAVITVSVDPEISLADLKILDHILRYIVQVPNTLDVLKKDKEKALDDIFDAIIRRKFLNV